MNDGGAQRIEDWSVIGEGRLSGNVYNRPGSHDGARIVTSQVLEVRMLGTASWTDLHPIAFTETGSAYVLGQPARSYGATRAKAFIRAKLEGGAQILPEQTRKKDKFDPEQTYVMAAVDASLHNVERIDVYATSFQPL